MTCSRPEASCNQIGGLLAFAFIEFDRAVLQNDCRADDKLQLVWDCYEKKTYEVNKKCGHKTKKKGDNVYNRYKVTNLLEM